MPWEHTLAGRFGEAYHVTEDRNEADQNGKLGGKNPKGKLSRR